LAKSFFESIVFVLFIDSDEEGEERRFPDFSIEKVGLHCFVRHPEHRYKHEISQMDAKHCEGVGSVTSDKAPHSLCVILCKVDEEREAEHAHSSEVGSGVLALEA